MDTPPAAAAAVDAARAVLPAWLPWASAATFVALVALASFAAAYANPWLLLRPLRRALAADPALPWHERARLGYPARFAATVLPAVLALLCLAASEPFAGPLARVPAVALGALGALTALLIGVVARRRVEGLVRGTALPASSWWAAVAARTLVLHGFVAVVAVGGLLMPAGPARVVAAATVVVMALVQWGSGLGLVVARAACLVRPPSPRLAAALERAIPSPEARRGVEVALFTSHAATTHSLRNGCLLLVSDRAVEGLDDDELAAAVAAAHAMGHELYARRWRALPLILAAVPLVEIRPAIAAWGPDAIVRCVIAAVVLFAFGLRGVQGVLPRVDAATREREPRPGAWADALERLCELNLSPPVLSDSARAGTQPWDRIRAVAAEATYRRAGASSLRTGPRPAAPVTRPARWFALATCLLTVATLFGTSFAAEESSAGASLAPVAITGGGGYTIERLAAARGRAGDRDVALPLAWLAAQLRPARVYPRTLLAELAARAGECEAARLAAHDAVERVRPSSLEFGPDQRLARSAVEWATYCDRVRAGRQRNGAAPALR